MPEFLAFRGLRYRGRTDASSVTAPPYDVIHGDEREALEARDPHNAVRLILPRPDGQDDRYAAAAALLQEWRARGVLALDPVPAFYAYRMRFHDRHGRRRVTHGVLGALALPPTGPGTGEILPHERTIPRHRSDRLALLRATRANLDPIWALTTATGLAPLLAEPGEAAQFALDGDGVLHQAWPLTDPERVAAIGDLVASGPLVLADGHHRFETACAYRDAHPDDPGAAAIMALVVELSESELSVGPIHRLVHRVEHVRDRLAPAFHVVPAGANTPEGIDALEDVMAARGGLGLVDHEGLALLEPRREVVAPALESEPPELRDVDAAVFEAVVLPRLGHADVEYRNDARALGALVARGAADAAILLRPVTVSQIRAAAYAGVRMPQKTTFFAPKPRTGLVFRLLDEP